MMNMNAPFNLYREASVTTASPAGLVVMLYEGVTRDLNQAEEAFSEERYLDMDQNLAKAQRIVEELIHALKPEVDEEFAKGLTDIYLFVLSRILKARTEKDPAHLLDVKGVWEELAEGWREAVKKAS